MYTGVLRHVFPLNLVARYDWKWCPREIALTPAFLKWCRRAALQFVVVKPVMALLTVCLYLSSWDTTLRVWSSFEMLVYNFTYTVALYALILLYQATKELQTVKAAKPLPKFVAVKLIVFATYWQSLMILMLNPHMSSETVKVITCTHPYIHA